MVPFGVRWYDYVRYKKQTSRASEAGASGNTELTSAGDARAVSKGSSVAMSPLTLAKDLDGDKSGAEARVEDGRSDIRVMSNSASGASSPAPDASLFRRQLLL